MGRGGSGAGAKVGEGPGEAAGPQPSRWSLDLTLAGWVAAALVVVGGALLVVAAAADALLERDGVVARDPMRLAWFVDHRSGWAVAMARMVTWLGSAPVITAVCAGAFVVFWRRGLALVVAVAPGVSAVVAVIGASVAKQVFGRPRPPVGLHLVTAHEPAFPSGHATSSAAVYLTISLVVAAELLRRWWPRVAAVGVGLGVAGMVGLSRLILGVHWPSDVVAGWALGVAVAVAVSTSALVVERVGSVRPVGGELGPWARALGQMRRTRPRAAAGP